LVVDDALAEFAPADKRALLDAIGRLPETTQIIYLTADPDTLAWARDHADLGEIVLWRPEDFATVA
jgi:uncharacterized protein YhaN